MLKYLHLVEMTQLGTNAHIVIGKTSPFPRAFITKAFEERLQYKWISPIGFMDFALPMRIFVGCSEPLVFEVHHLAFERSNIKAGFCEDVSNVTSPGLQLMAAQCALNCLDVKSFLMLNVSMSQIERTEQSKTFTISLSYPCRDH